MSIEHRLDKMAKAILEAADERVELAKRIKDIEVELINVASMLGNHDQRQRKLEGKMVSASDLEKAIQQAGEKLEELLKDPDTLQSIKDELERLSE